MFTDPFLPTPTTTTAAAAARSGHSTPQPGPEADFHASTFSRMSGRSFSHTRPTPDALRRRRLSSAFSRVSYNVPDEADEDEVKDILLARGGGAGAGHGEGEGEGEGGIVGAMFGRSVQEQIGSSWFW